MGDEKEMSMKERSEDWLKDERGVQIENPSDRIRNHHAIQSLSIVQQVQQLSLGGNQQVAESKEDDDEKEAITFVYIPQNDSKPMATLKLPAKVRAAHPGDAIPKYVQSFFADSKTIDTTLLKEQATKQFAGGSLMMKGRAVDSMENISAAAMQSVTAQGSVETFPLVHPADTNQYCGVYIYLDEVGLLKHLPQNKRASQMAATCGYHPPPQFYGDIFVGRVQTKPVMTNVNSKTPEDTTASAEWMQRAVSENLAWQQAMKEATGKKPAETQLQPNVQGTEGEAVQEEAYEWTQTEEEIEVRVPCSSSGGETWDKSKLKVNFLPTSIKIQHEGDKVVELQLYARVNVDGCTWTLDGGGKTLVVTCEKAEEGQMWPRIQLSA
jgi:hypothetical protein